MGYEHPPVGNTVLCDFYGVKATKLVSPRIMDVVIYHAASKAGCHPMQKVVEVFPDTGGFSIVWQIEESHIALHTYPEDERAYLDATTCGEQADPLKAYEFIRRYLKPLDEQVSVIPRGRKHKPGTVLHEAAAGTE
jgi:S-adenosylmethionine decarboxylase proenzyme